MPCVRLRVLLKLLLKKFHRFLFTGLGSGKLGGTSYNCQIRVLAVLALVLLYEPVCGYRLCADKSSARRKHAFSWQSHGPNFNNEWNYDPNKL
jgi:hypothetical protein